MAPDSPASFIADDAVQRCLDAIANPVRRRDAETLIDMLSKITGERPKLWGSALIGFGDHHYRYATGREGDTPAVGFAPRKASTSVYLTDGIAHHAEQLARLGPHSTGVGCLYLKNLDVIDKGVLEEILADSYRRTLAAGAN